MNIHAIGKITSSDSNCLKCSLIVRVSGKPDAFCNNCGAYYKLIKSEIVEDKVEMEYEYVSFICMFSNYQSACKNSVPSTDMYCKEHSDDKTIDKVKQEIEYTEKNLDNLKTKLSRIEESKKVWIINELSGLNDEIK